MRVVKAIPYENKLEGKTCNRSMKNSFAYAYLKHYAYEYLNVDEISAGLNADHLAQKRIQAGRLFFKKFNALVRQNRDFVMESTLSGRGFHRLSERLRDADYTIAIVFIFLESPAQCIARVRQRVIKGGHDVPASDIVRRFTRSKQNFWSIYKDQADFWYLFYNSGEYFQEVAIGESTSYTVSDKMLFDLFLKK